MKSYFIFIHLQFYLRNFFFTRGYFNSDWLFYSKLIWWYRTRPIFSKFDQTKICQILLYTLANLFDSINLIKLIWPCISGLKDIAFFNKFYCSVSYFAIKSEVLLTLFIFCLLAFLPRCKVNDMINLFGLCLVLFILKLVAGKVF